MKTSLNIKRKERRGFPKRKTLQMVLSLFLVFVMVVGTEAQALDSTMHGKAFTFIKDGFMESDVFGTALSRSLEASDGKHYKITVDYNPSSGIPENAELEVTEIEPDSDAYTAYVEKTAETLDKNPEELTFARAFDITIVDPETGEKYQPEKDVKVSVELLDQKMEESEEIGVVHFEEQDETEGSSASDEDTTDELSAQEVECAVKDGTVEFVTDGFSVYVLAGYTVDFQWGDYTYSMSGADSIRLSKLLEKLDVTEITIDDVKDVRFSDEELVKVEKQAGDWLLTSRAPFYTEETLTLELKNGESVEIKVTDATVVESGTWTNGSAGSGTWSIDSDGILTITGTGKMKEYGGVDQTEWYKYLNKNSGSTLFATKIVFENGITTIGKNSFTRAYYGEEIFAQNCTTLTTIGESAFKQTNYGSNPYNPANPKRIDFSGCTNLATISGNANVFQNCTGIQYLDISGTKLTLAQINTHFAASKTAMRTLKASGCSGFPASVDLSGFSNLQTIDLSDNAQITSLTLPTKAESLDITGCTKLKTLRVTNNTAMTDLDLTDTSVTSLTLSNDSQLATLTIPNGITSLTITNCNKLTDIHFDGTWTQWVAKGFDVPEGVNIHCDADEYTDLGVFFTSEGSTYVFGEAAPQPIAGATVRTDGTTPTIDLGLTLHFAETPGRRQIGEGTLTYQLPAGVTVAAGYSETVSVSIPSEGSTVTVTGAVSKVSGQQQLQLTWNPMSEDVEAAFWACDNVAFDIRVPVTIDVPSEIDFGDDIVLRADTPHDPAVESASAGAYNNENKTITFTAVLKANWDVPDPVVVSADLGTALSLIESGNYSYTITPKGGEPGAPVSFTPGSASLFTLNEMTDGDTVTVTIPVRVDPAGIEYISDPKFKDIGMTVSLTNEGNIFNDTTNDSKDADITAAIPGIQALADMAIAGEISGRGLDKDNFPYQDVTWTIQSNAGKNLTQQGAISGTIEVPFAKPVQIEHTGEVVITVTRWDSGQSKEVIVDTIKPSWADLNWDYDYTTKSATWSWTIPEDHVGKAYTYDITYTTRFLANFLTEEDKPKASCKVTGHTGEAEARVPITRPPEEDGITAAIKAVEVTQDHVTWEIKTIPTTVEHDSYSVRAILPIQKIDGTYYRDDFLEGSVEVDGLLSDEEFRVDYHSYLRPWKGNWVEISFHRTDTEGALKGTIDKRELTILLTTTNDADWIGLTGQDSELTEEQKTHTNRVEVRADETDYAEAEAVATPQLPFLGMTNPTEGGYRSGMVTIDGVKYPVFEFVISLGGVKNDMLTDGKLTVRDQLPDYWKLYSAAEDTNDLNAKVYCTETGDYPTGDAAEDALTATCDASGRVTFTLDPPEKGEGFWDYYQIVYHVVPKDANAFHELKEMTAIIEAGETVGEQEFTHSAELTSGTLTPALDDVSADFIFEYQPIQKKLTEMDGNWAYYQIDVNPDELVLVNGGSGLKLADTFYYDTWTDQYGGIIAKYPNYVAQSIDYSSIHIGTYDQGTLTDLTGRGKAAFEAAGISYDYSGYVGTFQFPDEKHIQITYRTRVSGEAGSTVTFLNDAVLTTKDTAKISYSARVLKKDCLIYPGSDDLIGNQGDYYIRLFKYAEGHMEYGLEGAQFLLHDANMKPMYKAGHEGEAGQELIFTTDANGYVTVRLDPETDGLALKKNTLYYLEEVEAPVGENQEYYKKDNTFYSFIISDNPNYGDKSVYKYFNNDVLKVRNYPEIPGIYISKQFTGNVKLTNAQKEEINFVLEKKNGSNWEKVREIQYDPATSSGHPFRYGYYMFPLEDPLRAGETYRIREENAESISGLSGDLFERKWILTTVEKDPDDENAEKLTTVDRVYGPDAEGIWTDACEFTITDTNKDHVIDVVCMNEYVEYMLTIKTVDQDDGAALSGAAFTVFDMNGHTVRTYTTGEEGSFDLKKSDDVRFAWDTLYYIEETRAPSNHLLPDMPEKIYFYFSSEANRNKTAEEIGLSVPGGGSAIDLSKDYDSITIENRRGAQKVPVRVAWNVEGETAWPATVDHVVIGLYYSVNGEEELPVTGEDGRPMKVTLTEAVPFNNTKFVNLAAEDAQGNRITYSVREEHVYGDEAGTVDHVGSYAPIYSITDAELYVVTNRKGVSIQVRKGWFDSNGESITHEIEEGQASFDLYRTTQDISGTIPEDGMSRAAMLEFLNSNNAELVRIGLTINGDKTLGTDWWVQDIDSLEASKENPDGTRSPYYYFIVENERLEITDKYVVTPATESERRILTLRNTGMLNNICQLKDESDVVLGQFQTLNDALNYALERNLDNITIEMLTDYIQPATDALQIPEGCTVKLTTAAAGEGGFVLPEGDTSGRTSAKITRYENLNGKPMFTNNGALIVENVILDGGGSEVPASREMVLNRGELTIRDGAVLQNAVNSGNGGAIYNAGAGIVRVTGGVIGGSETANTAVNGGGIYNADSGMVYIEGGSITGNSAGNRGGGIYNAGTGTVSVLGGSITDNSTTNGDGGAIYAASGAVIVSGGEISGNQSGSTATGSTPRNGGAIYAGSAVVDIQDAASITGNAATGSGGAVYSASGAVTVSGGSLSENTAGSNGGAIYVGTGKVTVSGGSMTKNAATGNGGAVYVDSGSMNMSAGVIGASAEASVASPDANTAQNGAAVFVGTGRAEFSGGLITGNVALDGGAVGVGSVNARLTFSGDVKITKNYDSTGSTPNQSNLCLDQDSDAIIYVGALSNSARIGVYVKNNVEDQRGIPGVTFGSFASATSDAAFGAMFSNDRVGSFIVRADRTAKRLYWGMPLTVVAYQIKKDDASYKSFTGATRHNSIVDVLLGDTTIYPRYSNADISVLAQSVFEDYNLSGKDKFLPGSAFGNAFANVVYNDLVHYNYGEYLTSFRWDKTAKTWTATHRDGTTVNLTKLYLYYARPSYISIENNTDLPDSDPRTLTISALNLTFDGNRVFDNISIFNTLEQIGYGYIVARDGSTRPSLVPVSGEDVVDGTLVLQPGDSLKLMLPGGCGIDYSLTASLTPIEGKSRTPGAGTRLSETSGTEGIYADSTQGPGEFALSGTTLTTAGGTYEFLFGGRKPVCRIVAPEVYEPAQGQMTLYTSRTETTTSAGGYEYLFATISNAVEFARVHGITNVTIEMLQDYLLPSSDEVVLNYGTNYLFQTAKDGTYKYLGTGNATISRDPGNKNSFISAIKEQTYAQKNGGNDYENPTFISFNTVIVQNLNFDGRNLAGSGDGGALKTKNWIVSLINCDFKNFVAGNGGAVFVEFGETFKVPGADQRLYRYSTVQVTDGKDPLNLNEVTNLETLEKDEAGNPILHNVNVDFDNARMTVENVSFDSCRSISEASRQGGGAIWTNARVMEIKRTIPGKNSFTNCTAYDQGGAIFHRIDSYYGGTISQLPGQGQEDWGDVLKAAMEAENFTTTFTGTITTIEKSSFSGCEAGAAGGMETDASIVKVDGCTFNTCFSTRRNGGGFNVYSNNLASTKDTSFVCVENSEFTDCHADNGSTNAGGGLRSAALRTYVSNCKFDNTSSCKGGAFACNNSNTEVTSIDNCTINDAQATAEGGGVYSLAYFLGVRDSKIIGCTSELSGGGIYHYRSTNNSLAKLENTRITDCVSKPTEHEITSGTNHTTYNGGGGLQSHCRTIEMTQCTIQNNTTTQDGGGINAAYHWTSLTMDNCVVTGNVSGNYGGGACSRGHVVVRNECIIMGNRLSHTDKNKAAGVYIPNDASYESPTDKNRFATKVLYLEADAASVGARPVNASRISENYTSSGAASNLRLAEGLNDNNVMVNRTDSVVVRCDVDGEFGVINAKIQGSQFGNSDGITAPDGFMDLKHAFTADDGSLYGILDRHVDLDRATKLYWAAPPICKITDENDNLLYLMQNGLLFPAVFDQLDTGDEGDVSRASALSLLRKNGLELYTESGTTPVTDSFVVKMLEEDCTTDVALYTANRNISIVLTTASGSDGDGFPYRGTAGTHATISRGANVGNTPLLVVRNKSLTLRNVEFDGQKNKAAVMPGTDTSLLYVDDDDATVILSTNALLSRAESTGNGGAVHVNKGNLTINGGAILSCDAENGGAVYMAGASGTLTMNSGSITDCKASNNGGGVYLGDGTFVMEGGSIRSCEAQSGGGVFVAAGKTMEMRGTNTSITNNRATVSGGGIATGAGDADATSLRFGGKVRVENNKLNGAECNVQLSADRNDLIYADGLSSGAHIGVYVEPTETELFGKHGEANKPFATYVNKTDEKYLYCFTNDYLGLKGGLMPDGSGAPNTVYWVKIFSLRVVLNILSDTPEDKSDTFRYQVTLKNPDGTPATDITGYYGEEETGMVFDRGIATFALTGETGINFREADGLPEGLKYIVEQVAMPVGKDGYYTVSPGKIITGTIGENNTNNNNLASKYLSTVTFNNIHAVCKIRAAGNYASNGLLYYKTGKLYRPAVYSELNLAFTDINRSNLYYLQSDGINHSRYLGDEFSVEMLVQNYSLSVQSATLGGNTTSAERKVTLTTADSDASIDGYPYSGEGPAVIKRADTFELSLLQVRNKADLTLKNITLDGNGDVKTASMSGGLVYVDERGKLRISDNATLQNSSTSRYGAAIYGARNAQIIMNAGTIQNNSTTASGDGAGIYLEDLSTLSLSGTVTFRDNFASKAGGITNGGTEFESDAIRQDIYIAGDQGQDDDKTADSLFITGNITNTAEDWIWVWADKSPRYKTKQQFAKIAPSASGITEDTLKVFRNARDDADTGADQVGQYLYGVMKEDDTVNVFWYGIEGSAHVMLVKVQASGNSYQALAGKTFTVYSNSDMSTVAKGTVLNADGTENNAFSLENLKYTNGNAFFIGELPYGKYYVREDGIANRHFEFAVNGNGVITIADFDANNENARPQKTFSLVSDR